MNNPIIVIAGASSGIGAALAKVFSNGGCSLDLLTRRADLMKALNLPEAL